MNTDETVEAVLDTNVLVSSALSRGKLYRILSLAEEGEIVSVTSPAIIGELRDVLTRERLPFTDEQVEELSSKILSISRVIEPQFGLEVIEDDPEDDKILEAAVAGDVDCIVSGDSHLLDIDEHDGIGIYSPDAFLEVLDLDA
ncbi:MAG: putative toxin-antitoxin system toxin component, PIN family [Candidatus Nanosalina sp.]